jgi:hypothetical protein
LNNPYVEKVLLTADKLAPSNFMPKIVVTAPRVVPQKSVAVSKPQSLAWTKIDVGAATVFGSIGIPPQSNGANTVKLFTYRNHFGVLTVDGKVFMLKSRPDVKTKNAAIITEILEKVSTENIFSAYKAPMGKA